MSERVITQLNTGFFVGIAANGIVVSLAVRNDRILTGLGHTWVFSDWDSAAKFLDAETNKLRVELMADHPTTIGNQRAQA